jgi:hypothetical protein
VSHSRFGERAGVVIALPTVREKATDSAFPGDRALAGELEIDQHHHRLRRETVAQPTKHP